MAASGEMDSNRQRRAALIIGLFASALGLVNGRGDVIAGFIDGSNRLQTNGTVEPAGPGAERSVGIDSVEYNAGSGLVTIGYHTSFPNGVDVYQSTDLSNWVPDGSEAAVGAGLMLERAAASPGRFYLLVEPGEDP